MMIDISRHTHMEATRCQNSRRVNFNILVLIILICQYRRAICTFYVSVCSYLFDICHYSIHNVHLKLTIVCCNLQSRIMNYEKEILQSHSRHCSFTSLRLQKSIYKSRITRIDDFETPYLIW